MQSTKLRSGFTKTGFSKSGFGACGHWQVCEMGKLKCIYNETDPEVKDYCQCYNRNHKGMLMGEHKHTVPNEEKPQPQEESESKQQLSLF